MGAVRIHKDPDLTFAHSRDIFPVLVHVRRSAVSQLGHTPVEGLLACVSGHRLLTRCQGHDRLATEASQPVGVLSYHAVRLGQGLRPSLAGTRVSLDQTDGGTVPSAI